MWRDQNLISETDGRASERTYENLKARCRPAPLGSSKNLFDLSTGKWLFVDGLVWQSHSHLCCCRRHTSVFCTTGLFQTTDRKETRQDGRRRVTWGWRGKERRRGRTWHWPVPCYWSSREAPKKHNFQIFKTAKPWATTKHQYFWQQFQKLFRNG